MREWFPLADVCCTLGGFGVCLAASSRRSWFHHMLLERTSPCTLHQPTVVFFQPLLVHPTFLTRRGPEAAGQESCPAEARLASSTGALRHGKACWGARCSRTRSPRAGCRHPGCSEPPAGAGCREIAPSCHYFTCSFPAGVTLTLSHPQPQPRAAIKQPILLPSCLLLLWYGRITPSAALSHAAGRCGHPRSVPVTGEGPRALLRGVPQLWFDRAGRKILTFMSCGRAGGSQEGCPPALDKLQLWGGGRKAALSESFVLRLWRLFLSLAPYLYEKARGGLEGFSLMVTLRKSTHSSPPRLSWEVREDPPPPELLFGALKRVCLIGCGGCRVPAHPQILMTVK